MVQSNDDRGDDVVVEWAPFRVGPGVSDAALLAGSEALQCDFLSRQRGFIRRELLRGHDGQWVDLVYWRDQESADEAMRAAGSSPVCAGYFELLALTDAADAGAGITHLRRVRAY